jgi:hypothetical protein
MNTIWRSLRNGIEMLIDAAGRLFTPTEEIPAIGLMPFGDDPYTAWEES